MTAGSGKSKGADIPVVTPCVGAGVVVVIPGIVTGVAISVIAPCIGTNLVDAIPVVVPLAFIRVEDGRWSRSILLVKLLVEVGPDG